MSLLRRAVRHAALSVLGTLGQRSRIPRALRRPRVQFLYFHHLFPDEEAGFTRLLEYLAPDHHFLPYGEAVRRAVEGPIDRPYIAFSFDDGIQNSLRAAEILEEHGARACFFVPTRIIGETSEDAMEAFGRERLSRSGLRFMDWNHLARLRERGHEIGGHTHSHVDLAAAGDDAARREIHRSYEILAERLGPPDHFAWPYGRFRHFTPAAARAVFDAGYRSCASAEPGVHLDPAGEVRALCVRRRPLYGRWPLSHQRWLMAAGVRGTTAPRGEWPDGWAAGGEAP